MRVSYTLLMRQPRGSRDRGQSVIEFTLMVPWLIFLFVGAFDWGYFSRALISAQSAARSAAVYGATLSSGTISSSTVCTVVLQQLGITANVAGLSGCTGPISDSQPVVAASSCTSVAGINTFQVTVSYQTPQLIPIPGLLPGKVTINRTAQLPMKSNATCTIS